MISFLIIMEIDALLSVYAPCRAAHIEKWILESRAAIGTLAGAVILKELHACSAIRARYLMQIIGLPVAAILSGAFQQGQSLQSFDAIPVRSGNLLNGVQDSSANMVSRSTYSRTSSVANRVFSSSETRILMVRSCIREADS